MSWRVGDFYKRRRRGDVGDCSGYFGDGGLVVVGWFSVRYLLRGGEKKRDKKRIEG